MLWKVRGLSTSWPGFLLLLGLLPAALLLPALPLPAAGVRAAPPGGGLLLLAVVLLPLPVALPAAAVSASSAQERLPVLPVVPDAGIAAVLGMLPVDARPVAAVVSLLLVLLPCRANARGEVGGSGPCW